MGHWSESLVDEAAWRFGGNPDRHRLKELLVQAGHEIDILAGRSFGPPRRRISSFEPNGLPFVDVPDLRLDAMESTAAAWPVPDPANPEVAIVLQVLPPSNLAPTTAPIVDALGFAGQLLTRALEAGGLSKDYVIHWLGTAVDHDQRMELMRRVMDPTVRFSIPILGVAIQGWWIQLSRRLIWVTQETEDEGRLVEPLFDEMTPEDRMPPLAAVEPILIVAPMTRHPANWAFTARVWTAGVQRPADRPWSTMARAIHGHGVPVVTLDSLSTPYETACQVVMKAYWHGYLSRDEHALANAIAMAYPQQVERIQRETRAPDRRSAAATLLEQLLYPGFDPARGAEATRRYVRRKASIAVMQYRKAEAPERYPWTQIGISERRYYKLLPLFAQKVNGRYDVEQGDIVARMKAHLDGVDHVRAVRSAALDVLRARGFGEAAARKWLQRHAPEEAVNAQPRRRTG